MVLALKGTKGTFQSLHWIHGWKRKRKMRTGGFGSGDVYSFLLRWQHQMLLCPWQTNKLISVFVFVFFYSSPGFRILLNSAQLLSILVGTGDKPICHLWSGRYIPNNPDGKVSEHLDTWVWFSGGWTKVEIRICQYSVQKWQSGYGCEWNHPGRVCLRCLKTLHSLRRGDTPSMSLYCP